MRSDLRRWIWPWIRCQLYLLRRTFQWMFSIQATLKSADTVEYMVEFWDKTNRKILIAACTGSIFDNKLTLTKVFYNPDNVPWPLNSPFDLFPEGATWKRTVP